MMGFGGCGKGPGGGGGHGGGPGGGGFGGFGGFGPPPFMRMMRRWAGGGDFGGGFGPGAMLADLDLSDEQLEQIAEIKMDGMSHFGQVASSMGSLMRQVARELANEQINKEKVKEIHQQILAERQKHGESMIDHVIAFAEVLTPEQRKKMKTKAIRRFLGMDRNRHDHEPGPGHDHDEHEHGRGRGR